MFSSFSFFFFFFADRVGYFEVCYGLETFFTVSTSLFRCLTKFESCAFGLSTVGKLCNVGLGIFSRLQCYDVNIYKFQIFRLF